MNLKLVAKRLASKSIELKAATSNLDQFQLDLKEVRRDLRAAKQLQELAQKVAQTVQQKVHQQLAMVVSRCLVSVFGEEAYEFRILFEKKRGKTEARLLFFNAGEPIDPLDGSGGGVVDVAAFGLRVAALIATQPPRRRLMVLDEPAKMLSKDYSKRFRKLLELLAKELEIQFILVTHNENLATGAILRLGEDR